MKLSCATIQMKATEQYFHVVLFIMLYKVVRTFTPGNVSLLKDKLLRSIFRPPSFSYLDKNVVLQILETCN